MKRMLAIRSLLSILPLVAGSPAHASLVAGWDFSQWFADGALSTDGSSLANTLEANYSSLDPTFNAGAESAAFGTLFFDGAFGSTNVEPTGFGDEAFVPFTGSLGANINAPVEGPGDNPFDSFTILLSEGQTFANELSMLATESVSVVFQANLVPAGAIGSDWTLTFGGRTTAGTSSVGVEVSTDGVSYTSAGTANLLTGERVFTIDLGASESQNRFVKLNFNPSGSNFPVLDNVAINATVVPEPGTLILVVAGLAGLHVRQRRRA